LQFDKTDDFFRHAFLLAGNNAWPCSKTAGPGSPGLTTHSLTIRTESENANALIKPILSRQFVMPDLIRHPVASQYWIADHVRNDNSQL
jgi:hypothetical protein